MIYVTSDWHGYPLEKIQKLFESVNFSEDDYCFVLGDVIDRGKDGIKLLKWLMLQPNIELILGNHEAMMLSCRFLFDEITEDSINNIAKDNLNIFLGWQKNGAQPTLDGMYSLSKAERNEILEYLCDAPLFDEVCVDGKKYIFTHSGLMNFNKNKDITEYSADELLWNRPSPDDEYYSDAITIFGHTPTLCFGDDFCGIAAHSDTWIDIDTGAAYGFAPMLLRLDDMQEFYLED